MASKAALARADALAEGADDRGRGQIAIFQRIAAAHSLAHLRYEEGAHDAAIAFLESWMPGYPAAGALHGHLSWHLALSLLQKDRIEEAFALHSSAFGAVDYPGPAIYKLTDAAAFLWRTELIGRPRDQEKWRDLISLARRSFPKPSFPFADWHIAVSETVANDAASAERLAQLEALSSTGYIAGAAVLRVAQGLAAYERRDHRAAIEQLERAMAERPRLGGSSAQTDLVEFTLARAYLAAGRPAEAASLAAARRSGPSPVLASGV